MSQVKETQNLLNSLPWTFLHGDFHVQQMAYREGSQGVVPGLDDFDDVAYGPFWLDLVRIEASALLVARSESFGDYSPGACTRAYVSRLADPTKDTTAKAYPFKPAEKPSTPFAKQDAWKTASSSVPELIEKNITEYIGKTLPNEKLVGIRFNQGGIGSFAVAKYLVLLESDKLLEFKEQEESPLSEFRGIKEKNNAIADNRRASAPSICNLYALYHRRKNFSLRHDMGLHHGWCQKLRRDSVVPHLRIARA